jgi:hypothetical protein
MFRYKFPATQPLWANRILGQETTPAPAPVTVGYKGVPGAIETVAVLGISAAAAWVGIRTGMKEKKGLLKYAGYVGGVGSGLIGLLYLGGQTKLITGIPVVSVAKG